MVRCILVMMVLALIIMIVNSYLVRTQSIPEMMSGDEKTVFIYTIPELHNAISKYNDKLMIVCVCRLKDGEPIYLFSINYQRLIEIFRHLPVVYLILTADYAHDSPLMAQALTHIRENAIFLLDGQPLQYDICCLTTFRSWTNHPPPVVIHTDQELVWTSEEPTGTYANQSECFSVNMPHVYKEYRYVFRTNYYSPLLDQSHVRFIPLGPVAARYTREFAETQQPMVKASERLMWCLFSGRLSYGYRTKYHQERGKLVDHILQQEEARSAIHDHRQCTMLHARPNIFGLSINHDEYLMTLSQTAFVPCPAGNNPETFRHYEVLTNCVCNVAPSTYQLPS
jgi:hypothetical protein